MNRITIYILLVLFPLLVNGQNKTLKSEDQILFDKAMDYYNDEMYDSSLFVFEKLTELFPESNLIGRANYNLGYINYQINNYEKSKLIFQEILKKNYNEFESNGLMEQYTLYKHRSCELLAEIFLKEENFQEANKYVKLFDKKYPYKHFCGNELAAYNIYRARSYARIFEGKKQFKKAIKRLLPFTFENGLASNEELLVDLIRITGKTYSKEEIKLELESAMKSLRIKSNKEDEYGIILLFGQKVEVHDDSLYALGNSEFAENLKLEGKEKFRKIFQTNAFFKKYLE